MRANRWDWLIIVLLFLMTLIRHNVTDRHGYLGVRSGYGWPWLAGS